MADESHLHQLQFEDLSADHEKILAWSRSLDTSPEQLETILRSGGEGARALRDLIGIQQPQRAGRPDRPPPQ